MSPIPDGYREQDGCWNCRFAIDASMPPKHWLDCALRRGDPDMDTHVADFGICPKHEKER